ncbi:Serine carboxypeptidase 3 [Mucor velutinosus]|uniref:Serine carboxypeptidase 3 n=1 Tax=Mucor velutinosus TaxID=708070 RepID=A0AAN7D6P4_9FUNG|nr:Serine carboxypeptidase 3 [Mucor velutinosus]
MVNTILILLLLLIHFNQAYIIQPRFGHSAVLVNDSIYFYGGDSSVSSAIKNTSEWLSELSILPIHSPYSLTDPPWKPASGPQDSIGGPSVYSHIAFMGGTNSGNMIVIGGVMPQTEKYTTDEEPTAYSYDCDLGRWNSFSLPSGNHLNRQGAASTTTEHGIAYIWGGKRAVTISPPTTTNSSITRPALSASMYRFDSTWPANSAVITPAGLSPPLRYAHTQTLISDHKIVVLGGFDSATGEPIPLSDIWVYDIRLSVWSQINAKLDAEKKPGARSSHSQVLMSDGFSILVYGGYDGYHVYNDVAVLDTRTWTWTVKNTNAAVQGRADHTATLVGSNMIVAFGFTGVSTALTVMADIEVLDVITWSWTSVYTPSPGYNTGGIGTKSNGGLGVGVGGGGGDASSTGNSNGPSSSGNSNGPSSPSIAIVAGAVTGGLVVFLLILVALYLLNNYHQKQRNQTKDGRARRDDNSECSDTSSSYTIAQTPQPPLQPSRLLPQPIIYPHHGIKSQEMLEIKFRDPPSSTEPFEYCQSTSRRPSNQAAHPLQINTSNLPTRSDTIGTATTVNSSVLLVPSPWTPIQTKSYKEHDQDIISSPSSTTTFGFNFNSRVEHGDSSSSCSADWAIRRAASTPTQHYHQHHPYQQAPLQSIASNISKPDDKFYPPNALRRAATVSELTKKSPSSSMATLSSASAIQRSSSPQEPQQPSQADDDDDALFDRQEFILESDEVAKVEEQEEEEEEKEPIPETS